MHDTHHDAWQSFVIRVVLLVVYAIMQMLLSAYILINFDASFSFTDAVYFVSISMGTIGLGDVMPLQKYWLMTMICVCFGISLFTGMYSVLFAKHTLSQPLPSPLKEKLFTKTVTVETLN
jgi:hypothetical protein